MQGTVSEKQMSEVRCTLERAVSRICPPWLADSRDDIVQNAMIRVAEILGRGEGFEISKASYLWKVAYTNTVDEIRRVRRRREDAVESETLENHKPSTTGNPEREAASRQVGDAIRDCLGDMVEPRRHAVLMHLYGYGLQEQARLMGWTPKRADNLLYRGMADLRRCLAGKGMKP